VISLRGLIFQFRDLPGNPGYTVPTPVEDPVVILDQYKRAAQFAKEAGFDGVELHAGNGYLCEQFLSDMSNKREDKWGGTRENRARFTLAAIDSLLEIWPAGSVG
jgi:2,4-dienoyl-CoA reductase-like NADH-dependent reductase (Old Yellow Enzyme family)